MNCVFLLHHHTIMLYRPSFDSRYLIPFYSDRISAGFPSPASDYEEEKIDLNEELIAHPSSTYMLRAEGNSMIGAGIFDQDLLVVDRSLTPKNGSIVIASLYGELTVKRLKIVQSHTHGDQIILAAENPDYPEIHIRTSEEIIWGVVSYAVRDLIK